MAYRDTVKEISPAFLREGTSERYMYALGLMLDALMQKMVEAGLARMPTKCDPSFLPVIGQDRLIPQGASESIDSYRVRLQRAFETWQLAGSARSVLGSILGSLLDYTPMIRAVASRFLDVGLELDITAATNATPIAITTSVPHNMLTGNYVFISEVTGNVAANGLWTITKTGASTFTLDGSAGSGTYGAGGIVFAPWYPTDYPPQMADSKWDTYAVGQSLATEPTHKLVHALGGNFDWDSLSQVPGSWTWYGTYLIIYAVAPQDWCHPPTWVWDDPDPDLTWDTIPGSWGLDVEAEVVQGFRVQLELWKPAQAWVRWIIICFDAALFDPDEPAGGGVNPDGTFGRWSTVVNGAYVASRFDDAEYCDGVV